MLARGRDCDYRRAGLAFVLSTTSAMQCGRSGFGPVALTSAKSAGAVPSRSPPQQVESDSGSIQAQNIAQSQS
jgi:hypothetical protein